MLESMRLLTLFLLALLPLLALALLQGSAQGVPRVWMWPRAQ